MTCDINYKDHYLRRYFSIYS